MPFKTTKNTLAIGTQIHAPEIIEAKAYLKKEFGNKYDADSHFNFLIMAMPEYRLKDIEQTVDNLFRNRKEMELKLGTLDFEPKHRFFSIPLIGNAVMDFHKELLTLLNPLRDTYIREKDLVRMTEGKTDAIENDYIEKYGYLRVLDKFSPHVTIGDINKVETADIDGIKLRLDSILGGLYNKLLNVNGMYATFIEEADVQSEYKRLWEKEYTLV